MADGGAPERDSMWSFGKGSPGQPVELFGLEEQDRVQILERCVQKTFHVGGRRRDNNLEPGDMGVEGLD